MLESSTPDTFPRVFGAGTGQSEWCATLPRPSAATPMTNLVADGRQDVLITLERHPKKPFRPGEYSPHLHYGATKRSNDGSSP